MHETRQQYCIFFFLFGTFTRLNVVLISVIGEKICVYLIWVLQLITIEPNMFRRCIETRVYVY